MLSYFLRPLTASKIWFKPLLRFFLNQNLSGYLQGLYKEIDENTNSLRSALNLPEEAGLLSAKQYGRRKVYSVNLPLPRSSNLSNMLRKVTGIDQLVDYVVSSIVKTLQQVYPVNATAAALKFGKYSEGQLESFEVMMIQKKT